MFSTDRHIMCICLFTVHQGMAQIFDQERQVMLADVQEKSSLLGSAVEDIMFLQQQNAELQAQLRQAAAWEFS